jgi:hypothetical protein
MHQLMATCRCSSSSSSSSNPHMSFIARARHLLLGAVHNAPHLVAPPCHPPVTPLSPPALPPVTPLSPPCHPPPSPACQDPLVPSSFLVPLSSLVILHSVHRSHLCATAPGALDRPPAPTPSLLADVPVTTTTRPASVRAPSTTKEGHGVASPVSRLWLHV